MGLKMKKTILYLQALILALISIPSYSQNKEKDSLTVKDVIYLSVQNRPLIRQKEEELRAAQSRVEQQRSAYLPNVEGGLFYTRIAPIPAFAFLGENLELAPADNYDFHVFIHQTLYDFGKRDTQFDLVQSQKESILDNEEMIKSDLSNSAVRIFYGILFLDKSIAVKDTQSASLNEHLTITDERIKSGTATDYDVLATKTKMSEIENEKIDLRDGVKIDLKDLIVVHDDVDLPFGIVKKQFGAGPAGHHGVEDIIEKVGTKDFWRIRVGIGKPSDKNIPIDEWVLQDFSDDEFQKILQLDVGLPTL